MYRLKVTVERIDGYCHQPMIVGDHFSVDEAKIIVHPQKHMRLWALQSMMPIFLLLQRGELSVRD